MSEADLLVVSHRGPVSYALRDGRVTSRRGGGGLIGVVRPVMERFGGRWIAAAMSEGDHRVAHDDSLGVPTDEGYGVRLLALPEDAHRLHYDIVCNEHLWFCFHYLYDVADTPSFGREFARAWEAYRHVNRTFAGQVEASERPSALFVQDYHLMLVAQMLRDGSSPLADLPAAYFHHTPWCEPDYFGVLPEPVRVEILSALLAYDSIGFHATRWARAFVGCCERFLPGAVVGDQRVSWRGREARVCVAPAPLDVPRVSTRAGGRKAEARRETLLASAQGRGMVVRVERVDLSKNVLRGLAAFEQVLEADPAAAQDLWFVALGYRSRTRVARYRAYLAACKREAARINERFSSGGRQPILFAVADDYDRSLAALRVADALLVNPVFDGLNMVAKEGALLTERQAALVLSQNAGAYEELGHHALGVNPFDVTETAAAISSALQMPAGERSRRAAGLRSAVTSVTPEGWARGQLRTAGLPL